MEIIVLNKPSLVAKCASHAKLMLLSLSPLIKHMAAEIKLFIH